MMEWKKDPTKKYTDLCIFIDANIEKLGNAGEYPELENKVYNYLWLLVKALSIKKYMFPNFDDYDPFSFYAANRLFFAIRKNLQNQGKTIKGKAIRPIKSCLNYTKALLYPMKIEYQRETYREIIDEEFISKKFDAFAFKNKLQESVRAGQMSAELFPEYLRDSFRSLPSMLDAVLKKSPFNPATSEYKKIKMSLILTCLNSIKLKNHIDFEIQAVILWKLPKSMTSYIKVLLKEFYTELKTEILDCYSSSRLDDDTVDKIINYREGPDYEYNDEH